MISHFTSFSSGNVWTGSGWQALPSPSPAPPGRCRSPPPVPEALLLMPSLEGWRVKGGGWRLITQQSGEQVHQSIASLLAVFQPIFLKEWISANEAPIISNLRIHLQLEKIYIYIYYYIYNYMLVPSALTVAGSCVAQQTPCRWMQSSRGIPDLRNGTLWFFWNQRCLYSFFSWEKELIPHKNTKCSVN